MRRGTKCERPQQSERSTIRHELRNLNQKSIQLAACVDDILEKGRENKLRATKMTKDMQGESNLNAVRYSDLSERLGRLEVMVQRIDTSLNGKHNTDRFHDIERMEGGQGEHY